MDKNIHRKKGSNGHTSNYSERFVLADKLDQGFGRHLFGNPFLATFTGTVPTMMAMGGAHVVLIVVFSSLPGGQKQSA